MKQKLFWLVVLLLLSSVGIAQEDPENIALGKTVVTSSVESAAHPASNAVDGEPATRWSTEYVDGQILDIDLEAVYAVTDVTLRWEAAFGSVYDIQVWDGTGWITVFSEAEGDGDVDEITLAEPVNTRYIRMNGIIRGTQWGFSLWEMEVYGTLAEPDEMLEVMPMSFDVEATTVETVSEEAIIYDFEDGEQPFTLADYWSGGTSLDVVDGVLQMGIATTGTEWQEGGFFIQPEGGLDWSAYDVLAMDIHVPEGARDFSAQIFMKTGDDWTWANTSGTTPIEDEWVTIEATLAELGDASAVNEFGMKIGTSTTVFEGIVQVDNMRLINRTEITTVDASSSTSDIFTSFEDGVEGWQIADYWAGSAGVDVSSDFASDGEQAMAVSIVTTGETWQEGGVFYQTGGVDWSAYTSLDVDIYAPDEASDFIAQIFVKTDEDWTWANTPDTPLNADDWTTISATLADLGDMTDVNEVGIKIGSGATAFDGQFYVDNMRLVASGGTDDTGEAVVPEVYDVVSALPMTEQASLYNLFEIGVELDAIYNNPYDPIDIRLDGQFRSPDGDVIVVPGFFMEEFITSDAGNPIATGESSWRVRFAPMQTGEWEYRVLASTLTTRTNSQWQSFTVADSDNPGFVRIDERNPRYFAFDDRTPYFPIGENMAWSTGTAIADYDMWLSELSANGGNFIRVWMASWGFGIEWQDTGLGDYSERQSQAYQLDEVIQLASEYDVYIMLTLLNHGPFNTTVNEEWDANPFNVANGGMLEDPVEFATNPEAIRYWNQRLRYIAARYGYSTNIMTWEWWNEVNWTPLVNSEVLAPWIERSAAYLGNLDPYNRLMSHSGSPIGDESVWNLESMDYTQEHLYNMTNLQQTFNNNIPEWLERYPDRPFLMGEFGTQSE
ncbi:MAG: discoidin domain-containing protein, partial [Chloroflexota bacterium]